MVNIMIKQFTMQRLMYGVIKNFDDGTSLWYEPITDEIDGFVLRDYNGNIIRMWQ